jgi:hypothetical protein
MSLFGRSKRGDDAPVPPRAGSGVCKLGVGRRVRSARDLGSARLVLGEILESYGPRQYPELPRLVAAGWEWFGSPAQKPAIVVCGTMEDGYPGFVTLRSVPEGTEAGIYDLAGEMTLPLVGHWKQRDKSLTSIGQADAGLAIIAPPVPDDYVEELVERLGFPLNQENWIKAAAELHQMFVLKAVTFMQQEPDSVAKRFIDDHGNVPLGVEGLRVILSDLSRWRSGVIPYIQDIPPRVRALIVQAGSLNESS